MAEERIHVVLEDEAVIAFVREKVRSGEYASESEVVREALETLRLDAEELERWESEVVGPAYDRAVADPSSLISAEQLERNLETRRRQRLKAS